MKKFMKVLMSCLVTCMVVQPLYAYADTVYTEGYLEYILEGESISICGYFGSDKEVTIPSTIAGYPVSKIKKETFSKSNTVTKIILPDTIMTIEEGAIGPNMAVVYDGNIERVPENNTDTNPKPNLNNAGDTFEKNSEDKNPENNDQVKTSDDNTQKTDFEVLGEEVTADLTEEDFDTKEEIKQDDYIYESQTIPYETMDSKKSGIGKIIAMIAIPVVTVGAGVVAFIFTKRRK